MANVKRIIFGVVVRIFNILYSILLSFGWDLVPLTIEEVIKPLTPNEQEEILRQGFNEPIRLIIEGCSQPFVTGFQRYSVRETVRQNIRICATVKKTVAENPDILNTPVDGPLLIVGLPRAGTTMLQRLLACDLQFLSPMTWEMMKPTPPGRPENWKNSDRYSAGKKMFEEMYGMLPDEFHARHFTDVDEHEECLLINSNVFLDPMFSCLSFMTKLREFQIQCPKEYKMKAYDYYKMALQCIFYKNLDGGKTLLLKAPIHELFLDTYKEILPKTKIIFIYRHLRTVNASCSSITAEYGKMFGDAVDPKFHGRQNFELLKSFCLQVMKTFKCIPQESFFTIGYSEVMKGPLEVVRRIYDHFNLKLTPEVEDSMQRHLVDNPQHKHGRHKYNLDEYGVTEEDIKRELHDFIEYFKDTPEKLVLD